MQFAEIYFSDQLPFSAYDDLYSVYNVYYNDTLARCILKLTLSVSDVASYGKVANHSKCSDTGAFISHK